jgi:uncharacterized cupin superfamily protein
MTTEKDVRALVLRAADRVAMPEDVFRHPLDTAAEIHGLSLSRRAGLQRVGLNLVRVRPGKNSFPLHVHACEEEFVFVLAGRGVVRLGDARFEVAHGDFVGFPAGGPPHQVHNPYDEDLVYLAGGERRETDVMEFPKAGRTIVRVGSEWTVFPTCSGEPLFPGGEGRTPGGRT